MPLRIAILPRNLRNRTDEAVALGASNDMEVLAEIARRYPDAEFYRSEAGKPDTLYSAKEMLVCYEHRIECR